MVLRWWCVGMGCWLREFDGDFFSIFFLSGLHELFLIEKSLEIAAYRGWGIAA